VIVDGDPAFQKQIDHCVDRFERAARQPGELAVVMREVLDILFKDVPKADLPKGAVKQSTDD
jgi:hypothetical protein